MIGQCGLRDAPAGVVHPTITTDHLYCSAELTNLQAERLKSNGTPKSNINQHSRLYMSLPPSPSLSRRKEGVGPSFKGNSDLSAPWRKILQCFSYWSHFLFENTVGLKHFSVIGERSFRGEMDTRWVFSTWAKRPPLTTARFRGKSPLDRLPIKSPGFVSSVIRLSLSTFQGCMRVWIFEGELNTQRAAKFRRVTDLELSTKENVGIGRMSFWKGGKLQGQLGLYEWLPGKCWLCVPKHSRRNSFSIRQPTGQTRWRTPRTSSLPVNLLGTIPTTAREPTTSRGDDRTQT